MWHINATATVAGWPRSSPLCSPTGRAGLDSRWLALDGDDDFFAVTKRIHNLIHGTSGDGGPVGLTERQHYERVLEENLADLRPQLRSGDVVLLHDPQTAGLIPGLHDFGVFVGWRSHIGADTVNQHTSQGWAFLRPYVEQSDAVVFSRLQFVPDWVPSGKVTIIAPSIDPLATKNLDLDADQAQAVLAQARLLSGPGTGGDACPSGPDDARAKVRRHDDLLVGEAPAGRGTAGGAGQPLGPAQGHERRFAAPSTLTRCRTTRTSCWSARPSTGSPTIPRARQCWPSAWSSGRAAPPSPGTEPPGHPADGRPRRERPPDQRHPTPRDRPAAEEPGGRFGLTVTEALWRARPVIASAIGGITDQITDGVDGLLLPDPGISTPSPIPSPGCFTTTRKPVGWGKPVEPGCTTSSSSAAPHPVRQRLADRAGNRQAARRCPDFGRRMEG